MSFQLVLLACMPGLLSASNARSHKFHIEGGKDGLGTMKTKSCCLDGGAGMHKEKGGDGGGGMSLGC